ncbi:MULTISPECIES: M10 family metallopeptidase C-terminal domain-containing protein [Yersinia]|uniref:M10 family metallopeptidase C-terminal domain-containing protein n=1 Tax=Yersinia TaxID=629 RepID=UPI0023E17380|nr:M10 family metallopeptidase C-terminal domain-containing protein [Yersinia sp. IP36721]
MDVSDMTSLHGARLNVVDDFNCLSTTGDAMLEYDSASDITHFHMANVNNGVMEDHFEVSIIGKLGLDTDFIF